MERTDQERTEMDRQIAAETGIWLGRTTIGNRPYADLLAEAQRKASRTKRRAGAHALVAKYGQDAASHIVARKTGQIIHFQ